MVADFPQGDQARENLGIREHVRARRRLGVHAVMQEGGEEAVRYGTQIKKEFFIRFLASSLITAYEELEEINLHSSSFPDRASSPKTKKILLDQTCLWGSYSIPDYLSPSLGEKVGSSQHQKKHDI